jgi:DNA-binding beta-propeller fold protein YncE
MGASLSYKFLSPTQNESVKMRQISGTTKRSLMVWSTVAILCCMLGCGTTKPGASVPPPTGTTSSGLASEPLLGYVWDQASLGLRPIYGLPGAAYFGAPIYNDGTYSSAVACGPQGYALLNVKNGQIFLAKLPSGTPIRLANALSPRQLVVTGPSCTTALVYGPDTANALLITGLPDAPIARTIALPMSGTAAGAAVADSGATLFAMRQSDGSVQVDAVAQGTGADTVLISLSAFGGVAFVPKLDNALVADSGKDTVSLISTTGANGVTQIANAADGILNPNAVAVSGDGRWGIVANSKKPGVIRLDLSRQMLPLSIPCSCAPSHLDRLSGNGVFRLTDLSTGPLWSFDGDAATPRIAFIPAVPVTGKSGVIQ